MKRYFPFERRKQEQLKKNDKSFKQSWDKPILILCEIINKNPDYYTTSSCSGRIALFKGEIKKQPNILLKTYHEKITLKQLKKDLEEISKTFRSLIHFKQEPCIIHIATTNLEQAQKLHDLGKLAGWKKNGIIASSSRFVVELSGTDKLEFPIVNQSKFLVDDNFLNLIIKESNKRLDKSWEKIEKLNNLLKN